VVGMYVCLCPGLRWNQLFSLLRSHDSSVGIVTRLWARRSRVWFLTEIFYSFNMC
jgi:hypothetical protein